MLTSTQALLARMAAINNLRKIKKTVDPASGMSVMVRRGCLSDRAEDEDNRPRRDWVELEMTERMGDVLDILIESQTESLRFWLKHAEEDSRKLEQAISGARTFLQPKN